MTSPDPAIMKWLWRFFCSLVACAIANFALFLGPIPTIYIACVALVGLTILVCIGIILILTAKKEGFFEKIQGPVLNYLMFFLILGMTLMARSLGVVYGTILLAGIWGLLLSVIFYALVR